MSGLGGVNGGRSGSPGRPLHAHAPPSLSPLPTGLLTGPRRRGGVTFTVLVSVLMIVGAGVMALVLILSDAPGALAVRAILAAIPVGPVIACFLWLDRYEPEPARLLATGHTVTVYNRTAARAEPLVRAGARLARPPREAALGRRPVVCRRDAQRER